MDLLAWAAGFCGVVILLTIAGIRKERRIAREAEIAMIEARQARARLRAKVQLAEFADKLTPRA